MSKELTIAMLQIPFTGSMLDSNLENRKEQSRNYIKMYIENISLLHPNVDMIVLPELSLVGVDLLRWKESAETIPGKTSNLMAEMARKYNKWIVAGSMFEITEDGESAYNTCLVFNPEGEIVCKYRKVFIPFPLEPSRPGNDFPVFDIPGKGRVAVCICADIMVPEIIRNFVFNGAELLIKPTLQAIWIGNKRMHETICTTRAMENQCYLVAVNSPAPQGMGNSCAFDPEGRTMEILGECEGYSLITVDFEKVHTVRTKGSCEGTFQFLNLKGLQEYWSSGG